MPVFSLFNQAFNFNIQQQPAGLPKSIQDGGPATRINIAAKAPTGVFPNYSVDAALTRESLNAMLRALLVDRYKIAYHYEDRSVDAYTLVAAKPKMTKADPSERTGCTRQSELASGTKITCKNITMAQFAEQLLALYPAARYRVLDGTHLDGAWDFAIEFNPLVGLLQEAQAQARARATTQPGAPPAPAAEASEPLSGPSDVAQAMEKQIGLKLESHKRPEKVLVIDHMEEKPTDN